MSSFRLSGLGRCGHDIKGMTLNTRTLESMCKDDVSVKGCMGSRSSDSLHEKPASPYVKDHTPLEVEFLEWMVKNTLFHGFPLSF